MKIRLLRSTTLESLRANISENLERYRSGSFSEIELDSSQHIELDIILNPEALQEIKSPVGDEKYEIENCLAVHSYLSALTPYDARDERLWTYLCHTVFLTHGRERWPIPTDNEKAIAHIQKHFFARNNRQIERDNIASRLWWMAHLCTRVEGVSQKEALAAFVFRSDVRASIVERPTVAQSANVFAVILKALVASAKGKKALFERATFRKVMMELNSIGGFRLLDALPESELNRIFSDVVSKRVGVTAI